eukprot:Sspe_Gene.86334::Locus_57020_Transcript_6_7_Confidence_0.222_Length_1065::g.86334::m.86334
MAGVMKARDKLRVAVLPSAAAAQALQADIYDQQRDLRGERRRIKVSLAQSGSAVTHAVFGSPEWFSSISPDAAPPCPPPESFAAWMAQRKKSDVVEEPQDRVPSPRPQTPVSPPQPLPPPSPLHNQGWNISTEVGPFSPHIRSPPPRSPLYGHPRPKDTLYYEKYNHKGYSALEETYFESHRAQAGAGSPPTKAGFVKETLHALYASRPPMGVAEELREIALRTSPRRGCTAPRRAGRRTKSKDWRRISHVDHPNPRPTVRPPHTTHISRWHPSFVSPTQSGKGLWSTIPPSVLSQFEEATTHSRPTPTSHVPRWS